MKISRWKQFLIRTFGKKSPVECTHFKKVTAGRWIYRSETYVYKGKTYSFEVGELDDN